MRRVLHAIQDKKQNTASCRTGQAPPRCPPFGRHGRATRESVNFKAPYPMLPSEAVREAKQAPYHIYERAFVGLGLSPPVPSRTSASACLA